MNKRQNNSARASALQITLAVALMSISAILLASSFKAAPEPKPNAPAATQQDGFYPPLPHSPRNAPARWILPTTSSGPGSPGSDSDTGLRKLLRQF